MFVVMLLVCSVHRRWHSCNSSCNMGSVVISFTLAFPARISLASGLLAVQSMSLSCPVVKAEPAHWLK